MSQQNSRHPILDLLTHPLVVLVMSALVWFTLVWYFFIHKGGQV